jgi:hypothetical protein
MQTFVRKHQRIIAQVICALLIAYGLYGVFSATRAGLTDSGDVHLQWFPGKKILLGLNPYTVDNADDPRLPSRPGMHHLPTNTAVMNFLFLPLSLLDWEPATWVFRILNLALAAITVLTALRLVPQRIPWWGQLAAVMALFGTHAFREGLQFGQTSLLLMLLMLFAMQFAPRNQWIAGLAFGIALSKISLSVPIALWFWIFGYWRVLVVAVLVQVAGFSLLALVTQQGVIEVVRQYVDILITLVDEPGSLDFTSTAQRANLPISFGFTFSIFVSIVAVFALGWRLGWRTLMGLRAATNTTAIERLLIFTFLCALTLIVVYHRTYDAVLLMMVPILVSNMIIAERGRIEFTDLLFDWRFYPSWILFVLLILPNKTIDELWPNWWEQVYPFTLNVTLVLIFAVLVWHCLTYRIPRPQLGKPASRLVRT